MEIKKINIVKSFGSTRRDRMFVSQLGQENKYSLAENNQKNILKSIVNITNQGTKSGTEFLLNVAKNMRFATNIRFNKNPKNQWMGILMMAAASCATKAGLGKSEELNKEFSEIFFSNTQLSDEEKEILSIYGSILNVLQGGGQSEKEIKPVINNLQYFIISSETSICDKKYILERLQYFLSDEYRINPQLKDKKFQVFSEIINDLSLDKVNSDIPNIKAVNQHTHGMCAAFCVTRKLLPYEYKRNYVDMILSELDDTDHIMVYDRKHLGEGIKIPVRKANIDYKEAINTGFRIIDASVANWMNIATETKSTQDILINYVPFDTENSYKDTQVKTLADQTGVAAEHAYYQALSITLNRLKKLKSTIIKNKYNTLHFRKDDVAKLLNEKNSYINALSNTISSLLNEDNNGIVHDIVTNLLKLQNKTSDAINSVDAIAHDYLYLPNEEPVIKKYKIKNFIQDRYGFALNTPAISETKIDNIYELVTSTLNIKTPGGTSQFYMAKLIVDAADSFRNQYMQACNVPAILQILLVTLNFPDEDTRIKENIKNLINEVKNDNEYFIEKLSQNMGIEPSKEDVIAILNTYADYVDSLPRIYDDLFRRMNFKSRKHVLLNELKTSQDILNSGDEEKIRTLMEEKGIYDKQKLASRLNEAENILSNKSVISDYAEILGCEATKDSVSSSIKNVLYDITVNDNSSKKEEIANALQIQPENVVKTLFDVGDILSGYYDNELYSQAARLVNQMSIKKDFYIYYEILTDAFKNGTSPEFVKEFLVNNGFEPTISEENRISAINEILSAINEMAETINTIGQSILIEKNGEIINSIYNQHIITKELENAGLILTTKETNMFREKFNAYNKLCAEKKLYTAQEYKKKMSEIKKLSPSEKVAINKILRNVNLMYKRTLREHELQFKLIKTPLEEFYRQYGVNCGNHWVGITPSSGLSDADQIKILEYVTDKPYYIQPNLKKAFEEIKGGIHSGTSGSSVSDSSLSLHAQYVTSIDTIKVPSKDNPDTLVEKDILFHDNSWGPSENENIWHDSKGMLRTDYKQNLGYKYGYITNDNLRNGTLTNDLLQKNGKMVSHQIENRQWKKLNENETFSFSLMPDMLLQGQSPKALYYAKLIRDTLFTQNDTDNIEILTEYAQNMTSEQLKHKLKVLNEVKLTFYDTYNNLVKRIKGDMITQRINSLDEYNALPDNDKLKIYLEKAAIRKTFKDSPYEEEIDKAATLESLGNLRQKMFKYYEDKFFYAFAKSTDGINYILSDKNIDNFVYETIEPALSKVNVVLSDEERNKIFDIVPLAEEINDLSFDGTLHSLAKCFANAATNRIVDVYGDKITVEVSRELRDKIFDYTIETFMLKPEDLDNGVIPKHIVNWIDNRYKVETNEQFIDVYSKLQAMTYDGFRKNAFAYTNGSDLGIEQITGYEILKEIQAEKESSEDLLFNEVAQEEIVNSYELSETEPYTSYERFSYAITATLEKKKNFDDTYLITKMDLNKHIYKKNYDKYKESARKKYNYLPAYPYLNLSDSAQELIEESLNIVKTAFNKVSGLKNQIESFAITENLHKFFLENAGRTSLSPSEMQNLRIAIQKFIKINSNGREYENILPKLTKILTEDECSINLSEYNSIIQEIYEISQAFMQLCTESEYNVRLQMAELDLKKSVDIFLKLKVLPQHRDRVHKKINEWLRALKIESSESEKLFQEVLSQTNKNYIMNAPEEILKDYLLEVSENKQDNKYLTEPLKSELIFLLNTSKFVGLQDIIMDATKNGIINAVGKEFNNVDIVISKTMNGEDKELTVKPMSSPDILLMILKELIVEDNYDIAHSFVEKFNLEDKVIPLLLTSPDVTMAKDALSKLENTKELLLAEQKIVVNLREEIKNIPDLDAAGIINQCSDFISELGKSSYDKDNNFYINRIIETFENVMNSENIETFAKLNTHALFMDLLDTVLANCQADVVNKIDDINDYFQNVALISEFVDTLNLDENLPLAEKVQNFNIWLDELMSKQNEIMAVINSLEM